MKNKGQISIFYLILFIALTIAFHILIVKTNQISNDFKIVLNTKEFDINNYYNKLENSLLYGIVNDFVPKKTYFPEDIKTRRHYE